MVKIINPVPTAKLFLKYCGRRVNLMYQESTFQTVNLEYNKPISSVIEPVAGKVRLSDGTDVYIGFLTRRVYKRNDNNQWLKDEESFLMHYDIIVDKSIVFITGAITNTINLNGEMIEENYKFRLFVTNDCDRMYIHIDDEGEDLVIEDFRK
ncbi:hypothetical protein C3L50_14670 [Flavobacterium alvei]|uniref:Uncharacterized protein n=1 Tax=Flavobacterium alvei TaxID=2080416 RepID=A0A2S5A590_9FLAO|nr:hypothetical protein [Flavobacterium alvei]POY37263.1 hypothetical protein C3L50_14670 [Flavobacterium alvei]